MRVLGGYLTGKHRPKDEMMAVALVAFARGSANPVFC